MNEQPAYYIVYAGNGDTTEGMVSENCQTDLIKAMTTANQWELLFKWGYVNRTIPGTPDTIIKKWGQS